MLTTWKILIRHTVLMEREKNFSTKDSSLSLTQRDQVCDTGHLE